MRRSWLLLAVLLTAVVVFGGYPSSAYRSNVTSTTKFIQSLRGHDLFVRDITEEMAKDRPDAQRNRTKVVLVEKSERVYIEAVEDVEAAVQERLPILTNPLIDFTGIPHLYTKDELIITYFGQHEKLLAALAELLGESLAY